ncbi:MAG: diacylglycerol kinase family protein [Bacilli bacterium]|jgi:diacylglycerol kinase|nr:diacylglycerol kinase family protein [Bacilli bacterium]
MKLKIKYPFKKKKSQKYLYDSNKFFVAFKGIKTVFLEESSVRYQLLVLVATILLGILLRITIIEWVAIIILAIIVFTLEIINTAIENIVDMISPEYNKMAGKIKDIAAGAVLISTIGSILVGVIIFYPRVIDLLWRLS